MAKTPKQQSAAPAQPKLSDLLQTKYSFRVEKLNQFEFQAIRGTRQDDGTYVEEKFGTSSLFTLVMRKIFDAMNDEAHQVFMTNKTRPQELTK